VQSKDYLVKIISEETAFLKKEITLLLAYTNTKTKGKMAKYNWIPFLKKWKQRPKQNLNVKPNYASTRNVKLT